MRLQTHSRNKRDFSRKRRSKESNSAVRRNRKRLVVSQKRYERACKYVADANVTFHGKGGARKQADVFL